MALQNRDEVAVTANQDQHAPTESNIIGVGDLIKRMTNALGIPGCRGCEWRRRMLNRWKVNL